MYCRNSDAAVNLHHYDYYLWLLSKRINSIQYIWCLENIYKKWGFQSALRKSIIYYPPFLDALGRLILPCTLYIHIKHAFFKYIFCILNHVCITLY